MTIEFVKGDIFESGCEVLVNPVNCKGVMGKGLALQFKQRFPEMFENYKRACDQGRVSPGSFWAYLEARNGIYCIFNLATKDHWRDPSKIEWITLGLAYLAHWIVESDTRSIALPALGCGEGGLKWEEVKPLIEKYLGGLKDVKVVVYEPR